MELMQNPDFLYNKNGSSQRKSDVPHINTSLNCCVKYGERATTPQLPYFLNALILHVSALTHLILTGGHPCQTVSMKEKDCVEFMTNFVHRY